MSRQLTGCALAAPPPIDGNHIVAETGAEKRPISLDAKRRPLQARVGRATRFLTLSWNRFSFDCSQILCLSNRVHLFYALIFRFAHTTYAHTTHKDERLVFGQFVDRLDNG